MKVIFIDANIYLRFYDSNHKEFKKLLYQLLEIKDKIFITSQIVDEVQRNKLSVFQKSIGNYRNKVNIEDVNLPEHFAMDLNSQDIISWNKKRKELSDKNLQLIKELEFIFNESLNKISSSIDNVSLKLNDIFKNNVRENDDELLASRKRKEMGNPPGKANDTLGDQISWEQFLSHIPSFDEIWIISNDFDYFTQHNKTLYLNSFLKQELLNKKHDLKINCFNTLGEGMKSFLSTISRIDDIAIKELDVISKEERLLNKISVSSSNIASIGYDQYSQTLEIEFAFGGIYQYSNVPNQVYEGLMSADSLGKYFSDKIRNIYPSQKK